MEPQPLIVTLQPAEVFERDRARRSTYLTCVVALPDDAAVTNPLQLVPTLVFESTRAPVPPDASGVEHLTVAPPSEALVFTRDVRAVTLRFRVNTLSSKSTHPVRYRLKLEAVAMGSSGGSGGSGIPSAAYTTAFRVVSKIVATSSAALHGAKRARTSSSGGASDDDSVASDAADTDAVPALAPTSTPTPTPVQAPAHALVQAPAQDTMVADALVRRLTAVEEALAVVSAQQAALARLVVRALGLEDKVAASAPLPTLVVGKTGSLVGSSM